MRKILSFIICLFFAVTLYAGPANRKPFVVKQSDGTMLSVVMQGDEALHFYTTLDGKYVVKSEEGDFFYATFTHEGGFVSTGSLAHDAENRTDAEKELLSAIDYEVINNAVLKTHSVRSAQYANSLATRAVAEIPTKGEVLVPVLLVEFQDVKFSFKKEDLDRKFNEVNYDYTFTPGGTKSIGSVRDYFIAQSDSLFFPKFVMTDIVTLPKNMVEYGGNNTSGNDRDPYSMISSGVGLADATTDFSQFDNDGDGKVDFLICIYAGYSEANNANANTVWPHKSSLAGRGISKKADGVSVDIYACAAELTLNENYEKDFGKWLDGIGAICHEFSHCLGLSDVYDVVGTSGNWCMQEWDLMDYGNFVANGYIPVGYNSFQKESCGWKKMEVLDEKGKYSMKPLTQGGVGCKIVNDANPNEYFVLENRKCESWDQTFSAEGMMIIHVDYDKNVWSNNRVNVTAGHPRFQIVPADNDLTVFSNANSQKYYESLAGDLWPGKNNNNEFTDTSLPKAKVFTGGTLGKPVTNIKYENDILSFNFMGATVDAPEVMSATDVTDNSFVANWSAVKDATGYVVELFSFEDANDGNGDVVDVVEDFLNCNKSAAAIQDDMDTYMSTPGWSGSNVYSEMGKLCIGSLNNAGALSTPILATEGELVVLAEVAKYNSRAGEIKLLVEVVAASGDIVASKVVTETGEFELKADVAGTYYVRFSTDASAENKRLLIDNIVVAVTQQYRKVLVESVATTATSHEFCNLETKTYAYRVKAVDGYLESECSEYMEVDLATTSITDIHQTGADVEVYTITGIKLCDGNDDVLRNLPRGVYVVKSTVGTKKIKVE